MSGGTYWLALCTAIAVQAAALTILLENGVYVPPAAKMIATGSCILFAALCARLERER